VVPSGVVGSRQSCTVFQNKNYNVGLAVTRYYYTAGYYPRLHSGVVVLDPPVNPTLPLREAAT
jgi:hypothetical protein